jgi:hypothetical protein
MNTEQRGIYYARNSFGHFKQQLYRERQKAQDLQKLEKIFSLAFVDEYDMFDKLITIHLPEKLSQHGSFLKKTRPLWEPILKNIYGERAHLGYYFYLDETEYPKAWDKDIEALNKIKTTDANEKAD